MTIRICSSGPHRTSTKVAYLNSSFIFQLKDKINVRNEGQNRLTSPAIPICFAPFKVMKYKNDVLMLKNLLGMREILFKAFAIEYDFSMKKIM